MLGKECIDLALNAPQLVLKFSDFAQKFPVGAAGVLWCTVGVKIVQHIQNATFVKRAIPSGPPFWDRKSTSCGDFLS